MTTIMNESRKINIINKFGEAKNSTYFKSNYVVEDEKVYYEPGYKIIETTYFDKLNNVTIKNKNKYCMDYLKRNTRDQEIRQRKKWKKFGSAIKDESHQNEGNVVDDVFIQWNPEIFHGEKTRNYMKDHFTKYLNNEHKDEIQYQEDKYYGNNVPTILEEYNDVKEIKKMKENPSELERLLNILISGKIDQSINLDIEDKSNNEEKDDCKPKLFSVNKSRKSENMPDSKSGYVPPHSRNSNDSSIEPIEDTESKQHGFTSVKISNKDHIKNRNKVGDKKIDKKCIRVLNLPNDYNFQTILNTFKPIFGRLFFKIRTLTDRRTGNMRDFCFLNFKDERSGDTAFELISDNKIRIGYNILKFEWGIKRD
jgi:hypothetical protein